MYRNSSWSFFQMNAFTWSIFETRILYLIDFSLENFLFGVDYDSKEDLSRKLGVKNNTCLGWYNHNIKILTVMAFLVLKDPLMFSPFVELSLISLLIWLISDLS